MHIFLNGLGASSSSGLTYLRNVVPHFSRQVGVRTTLAVQPAMQREFTGLPNVSVVDFRTPRSTAGRFSLEQIGLSRLIKQVQADILISAGNFALWKAPVPQILLSGNSLYTSRDFLRDLKKRRAYVIWLDNRIKGWFARRSVKWADCTVAPTQSFARELEKWTTGEVLSIYHGFDPEIFQSDAQPLSAELCEQLNRAAGALRLLFVSHYNYYRNFETLFCALAVLKERLRPRPVRLLLTCKLQSRENPGTYHAEGAAALVEKLGISQEVVQLGAIPYRQLHHIYKTNDIYVTPAYAETFAHPVVEAMASGLPVVASDLPVHREICGSAAVYFERFSPVQLADQLARVANSDDLRATLSQRGRARSRNFSWARHVVEILQLAEALIHPREEAIVNPAWTA